MKHPNKILIYSIYVYSSNFVTDSVFPIHLWPIMVINQYIVIYSIHIFPSVLFPYLFLSSTTKSILTVLSEGTLVLLNSVLDLLCLFTCHDCRSPLLKVRIPCSSLLPYSIVSRMYNSHRPFRHTIFKVLGPSFLIRFSDFFSLLPVDPEPTCFKSRSLIFKIYCFSVVSDLVPSLS